MTQHKLNHATATPTTVKCPKCGDIIVYNGNYFCNSYDAIVVRDSEVYLVEGTCDWALPHPTTKQRDRDVVDELFKNSPEKVDYE